MAKIYTKRVNAFSRKDKADEHDGESEFSQAEIARQNDPREIEKSKRGD